MKRKGGLFEKAFSQENLYSAYLDARQGKRRKRSCFQFELNLGGNLKALREAIHDGTYRPQPYHAFMVHEPKPRLIRAPAFEDTVVQHAIYRVIYTIFDRCFVSTSFACRKGYGTHRASDYAQSSLRACDGEQCVLKLDVRRFFYSIDRDILRSIMERHIKDFRLLDVVMLFAVVDEPLGIPIGNLLSQLLALIYLNPVDHYIKRRLKVAHYARYVDDMVLFGFTRDQCVDLAVRIGAFLKTNLHLEYSRVTIQKVRRGVNFVGYRTWRSRRFIRKYSLHKFSRKVRAQDLPAVVSLLGHARRTNSLPYMLDIYRRHSASPTLALPRYYRRIACQVTKMRSRQTSMAES